MANIPKKAIDRLTKEVGKFQKILTAAKVRDINEADTLKIVTDMLSDIFGFDKYTEITSEYVIKGTYCDIAVKIDDALKYLMEVKAVGIDLKDGHLKQAINYGATRVFSGLY
ncbi:MAG: hypothetical protein Q7J27_14765 [Syntrophales bacterium]|nr:hypothetical protein [Syntrophales bacterium]